MVGQGDCAVKMRSLTWELAKVGSRDHPRGQRRAPKKLIFHAFSLGKLNCACVRENDPVKTHSGSAASLLQQSHPQSLCL